LFHNFANARRAGKVQLKIFGFLALRGAKLDNRVLYPMLIIARG
jgi:hypothetical protein